MSSPGKRSPMKKRPTTAANQSTISPKKSNVSQMAMVEEHNSLQIQNQDKDIEIERLQTTCYTLNNKVSVTDDLHKEIEVLNRRLQESENIRQIQKEEIASYEQSKLEHDQRTKLEIDRMRSQLKDKDFEIDRMRSQQEAVIADYERIRVQQKKENQALIAENESLKRDLRSCLNDKSKLQNDVEESTDYIINMEEKVFKSNKISLELLKQLKDAEMEISTLQQYIVDLKQRIAVYIPIKNDTTDKKLAEFINNYPERSKLKIMFMRESEGVYQFGSKRVQVKVEREGIKIRVGGGYLSIDEFLDQYTPVELEKLERKDPLKRFSEKIAVQKTIADKGIREESPVTRSPGRQSPNRKVAV